MKYCASKTKSVTLSCILICNWTIKVTGRAFVSIIQLNGEHIGRRNRALQVKTMVFDQMIALIRLILNHRYGAPRIIKPPGGCFFQALLGGGGLFERGLFISC